ncbi:hypothetical protein MNB_SV-5-102 [hydrothermal vent metagenome]|uniref:DUF3972 domain-containing protein n=1 Tax=hydrothermal vent metagenome TaxID=652676 RepID=A0A1W1EFP9_9ZZZZ
MEKLMKPVEYAKELGISRQAVYAKIKKGILTAKNVDGKLYIVIDNSNKKEEKVLKEQEGVDTQVEKPVKKAKVIKENVTTDYKTLLAAKDETIAVLKGTVKDLKKSNKQISTTLKGEISILKEAFHEMRNIYALQLEHKKTETIDVMSEEASEEAKVEVLEAKWVSRKKFFKKLGIETEKQKEKIMKRLKKAHVSGDECFKKKDGKLRINLNKDYSKILK